MPLRPAVGPPALTPVAAISREALKELMMAKKEAAQKAKGCRKCGPKKG